jgi:hypothetical protein
MSIRTYILTAAAVGGLAFSAAGPAAASTTDQSALAALRELCEDRGGLPVNSPYHLSRCQGARANKGFDTEQQLCDGLGNSVFSVVISDKHMNRATWACTSTVPVR